MTADAARVPNAVCLGCGCACDDIELTVSGRRIVEARNACALGLEWFGDGHVTSRVLVSGTEATLDEALAAAADLLNAATSPLVYLALDLTCEAQRAGVALADALRATLDTVTTATALPSILAGQERGRAGATLGELRNRADVIVWWGVDPDSRYPRLRTRYAPDRPGLHVPDGRRSRRVIAVDIGAARGPSDADERYTIDPGDEVATLTALRAIVSRHGPPEGGPHARHGPPEGGPHTAPSPPEGRPHIAQGPREGGPHIVAAALASTLRSARYAAIVADAEPDDREPRRDPGRADALIATSQSLNGSIRAALTLLRGGGNRSGADAVLTSQAGYPAAIDFSRGFPRYRPFDGSASARLANGQVDAAAVIGSAAGVPAELVTALTAVPFVAIGPRATAGPWATARASVDTAVAGIHEQGVALRMDDVPLPLGAPLDGVPSTQAITRALRERIVTVRRRAVSP